MFANVQKFPIANAKNITFVHMNQSAQIMTLTVVNELQYVEVVLEAIAGIARRFSMAEKEILTLCTATEEAMVNVIHYGYFPDERAYFDIAISVSDVDFTVSIRDKGKPFDFSTLKWDDEHIEGLSVKMMRELTDKVEFRNLGSEGREQLLTKRLVLLPQYQSRPQEEAPHLPEQIDFEIHPLRQEEAIEVAQCIYDEFGYTYVSEIIYYPQPFFEACQRGEIVSLVAVTHQGEVAGHLALMISKEFPGTAEMGIGVVKRKYRKYSLMNRLTELIIYKAQHEFNLTALYAQPVAYHTITQKLCNHYHLTPCNFSLHYTNDEFATTFAGGKSRSNVACAMLPFLSTPQENGAGAASLPLYLPKEVAPMIGEIVQNMGLTRHFGEGTHPTDSSKTVGTLSINQRMRLGKYFVEQAGSDFPQELKNVMRTLKREKCAVAEMFINLSDQAAPFAYQAAKKYDFFCTGIMPQTTCGDYLTMEWLMNDVVDYEIIKTIEPFTTLLNHIKTLDPNER